LLLLGRIRIFMIDIKNITIFNQSQSIYFICASSVMREIVRGLFLPGRQLKIVSQNFFVVFNFGYTLYLSFYGKANF